MQNVAKVKGKIEYVGSRLIQNRAKKLAGKFFTSYAKVMEDAYVDRVNG